MSKESLTSSKKIVPKTEFEMVVINPTETITINGSREKLIQIDIE
jgi:hypothetical protein